MSGCHGLLLLQHLANHQGALEEVFESLAPSSSSTNDSKQLRQLSLRYSFPRQLVEKVGAPPTMWTIIRCVDQTQHVWWVLHCLCCLCLP